MNIFGRISGLSFSEGGQLRMPGFLWWPRARVLSASCHFSGDKSAETEAGVQIAFVNEVNLRIRGIKGLRERPCWEESLPVLHSPWRPCPCHDALCPFLPPCHPHLSPGPLQQPVNWSASICFDPSLWEVLFPKMIAGPDESPAYPFPGHSCRCEGLNRSLSVAGRPAHCSGPWVTGTQDPSSAAHLSTSSPAPGPPWWWFPPDSPPCLFILPFLPCVLQGTLRSLPV